MGAETFSVNFGDWGTIVLSSAAILVAAVVRGFAGFGFSLISITAISLLMPVAQIVPTIFLMEILASLNLLPGIWREIDWRSLRWVLLGYVAGLPIGTLVLVSLPEAPARIALGLVVIAAAILMLKGFRLARRPGSSASTGIGAASGLLNGAFGVGGPPVVLFYFSAPGAAAIGRASIIFYFFCSDLLGAGYFATQGLITGRSFIQLGFWLPALLLGVWLGARSFRRTGEDVFRRWVLRILIALAALVVAQSVATGGSPAAS
ncbi:sulfite exporter TauE/SafE family protein [Defluviimonas sp. WL0024]|uniref:Probable membrane transporter protein n=1 Tax=Albidovulum salinarum TaxID=2984153 RepID=A0ABT2X1F9_9RHOB|nr:sulfite exporter TauE/SafE family protein [Defluviimonas sp. WL0024]MCU9847761.1 sulfite exporter TauE/SafE family protein [Defluviimonas sp. WL0024]